VGKSMHRFDEEYIKTNFARIWPRHVETLTWFLIQCRKHFNGDLDLFLVLAVIGDRSFSAARAPEQLTYEALIDGSRPPVEPEALNAQSVSDFSGIPRETVRRKINKLIDRGWVERGENGYLRATRQAALDLHPLTETSFIYLSRMAAVFAASK
jgi:hypothetical protein